MKLLIGLGNPGEKYKNNRHNVGHMFVDYLNGKQIGGIKIRKTDCFMNSSGIFVRKQVGSSADSIKDLIIAHDDLDIPLGIFHIQSGVGPRLHNGIESVENHLKTKDFLRVRIGVDNRPPENRIDGETYVLNNFSAEEKNRLQTEIFPKILEQLKVLKILD